MIQQAVDKYKDEVKKSQDHAVAAKGTAVEEEEEEYFKTWVFEKEEESKIAAI